VLNLRGDHPLLFSTSNIQDLSDLTFVKVCGTLGVEAFMTQRQVHKAVRWRHLLLILTVAMLLYVGLDFFQQVRVSQQLREELGRVEVEIIAAQEEQAEWEKRLEYAQSPQAAEEWARENVWAKSDEVPVVVVGPRAEQGYGSEEILEEDAGPDSSRDAWRDLFFGTR
jgi:hypothetical protein